MYKLRRRFWVLFLTWALSQLSAFAKPAKNHPPKEDCSEQFAPFISDYCVQNHFCPKAKAPLKDGWVFTLLENSRVIGAVGIQRSKKTWIKVPLQAITAYKSVFHPAATIATPLRFESDANDAEIDRCTFKILVPNLKDADLSWIASRTPNLRDPIVRQPTAAEKSFFGQSFQLCEPDSGCSEEQAAKAWNILAVTDLNEDGQVEFWALSPAQDFRRLTELKVYSPRTKKWDTLSQY